MPGPKYVKDFQFDRAYGFTGSADQAEGRSSVRAHTRQPPQRFARGGAVRHAMKPATKVAIAAGAGAAGALAYHQSRGKPKKPVSPSPGPRGSAIDAARGTMRRRREQDLGLSHGGPVTRYAKGGSVGHATVQRSKPTTELDKVAGGKTPLRPGFKKGGKPSKMC